MLPSRVSTHWNMLSGPPSPEQMKTACWVRLALMTDGVAATLPSGDTARERHMMIGTYTTTLHSPVIVALSDVSVSPITGAVAKQR